jgi:hypothetical protein
MNSVKSTLSEDVFKKCGKQEKLDAMRANINKQ